MKARLKAKVQKIQPEEKRKYKPRGRGFVKGDPRAGRPKGSHNKFTTLKQAFLDAFEDLGGVEGLVTWVKKSNSNRATFYQMITKMLPKEVHLGNPTESPETLPFIIRVEAAPPQ